jgi:hypothetical protein
MKRPIKKTLNRFTKHLSNAGTIRLVGGRHWLVFTPAAIRTYGLKKGQRVRISVTPDRSLKITLL